MHSCLVHSSYRCSLPGAPKNLSPDGLSTFSDSLSGQDIKLLSCSAHRVPPSSLSDLYSAMYWRVSWNLSFQNVTSRSPFLFPVFHGWNTRDSRSDDPFGLISLAMNGRRFFRLAPRLCQSSPWRRTSFPLSVLILRYNRVVSIMHAVARYLPLLLVAVSVMGHGAVIDPPRRPGGPGRVEACGQAIEDADDKVGYDLSSSALCCAYSRLQRNPAYFGAQRPTSR